LGTRVGNVPPGKKELKENFENQHGTGETFLRARLYEKMQSRTGESVGCWKGNGTERKKRLQKVTKAKVLRVTLGEEGKGQTNHS